MGPTGCPETSIRNYNYSLRNNSEERSSLLLRGGSLESREVLVQLTDTTSFTCTKIHTRQTLVKLLHVSTRCRCAIIRESIRWIMLVSQNKLQRTFLSALSCLPSGLHDDGICSVSKHVADSLTSDVYILWCT